MNLAAGGCTVCRICEAADTLPGRPIWLRLLAWLWARVPKRVRRVFEARFADVSPSEATGYAVWTAMGIVVGVPEIWAAVEGTGFYWPTISTTIGHLQERWPVVALLPVAAIVMGAYSVLRIRVGETVLQADQQALGRTVEGRLVKQDVSLEELARGGAVPTNRDQLKPRRYFALATAVVVAGSFAVAPSDNPFASATSSTR